MVGNSRRTAEADPHPTTAIRTKATGGAIFISTEEERHFYFKKIGTTVII